MLSKKGTSLNAVVATGAGDTILLGEVRFDTTCQIFFTGTVTALVVDLEGGLDGSHFDVLGTKTFSAAEITAKFGSLSVNGKGVNSLRLNVTTYTGTGPVTGHVAG